MSNKTLLVITLALAVTAALLLPGVASAHNVSKRDGAFVQANK